jgi:hypothetical protein
MVMRNAYRILVGKPEGKTPLGRPRRRREDNIKIDLGEIGCDDMDWIDLAKVRHRWMALVKTVMDFLVSIKRWKILKKLRNWQLLKKASGQWS